MNIGIDARLLERKITGIGRVLKIFLEELPSIDKKNNYFLFSYSDINKHDNYFTTVSTVKSFLPQKLFSPIWINFILPKYLKKNKIDVFFSVNQLLPLVKLKNIKYVLVLHDVIYKADKTFHPFIYRKYLQFFTFFSVNNSELIITDSYYSKQDILKFYNVAENKIKVIYPAAVKDFKVINLAEREVKELKQMFNLPQHIILYVGMIENRKNIMGILKIADEVYTNDKDIKFVLVGKIGYGGKKLLNEINNRKNVIHLRNIEDHVLQKIYNISTVFLFPSLYEGFGFPPLEAMQSGLPVLASNTTSLKEIIDSGGLLHDPNDYHSFTQDILKLIEDRDFYDEVRKRGLERAKNFTMQSSVRELVNAFNSLENKVEN